MKYNEGELVALLGRKAADWEGRLTYRPPRAHGTFAKQAAYKERYFKLLGNLLFCLRINSQGKGEEGDPVQVLVMENVHIEPDGMQELNSFSATFRSEEEERRHSFVTDSPRAVAQWVEALRESSYVKRREKLIMLQIKLRNRTGTNPLQGTNLEGNPVYSPGASPGPAPGVVPPPSRLAPPVPVVRTRPKVKGFTSHLTPVDTSLRDSIELGEEVEEGTVGATKPSFTSHVPTADLINL